jgi:hypothetical protein
MVDPLFKRYKIEADIKACNTRYSIDMDKVERRRKDEERRLAREEREADPIFYDDREVGW